MNTLEEVLAAHRLSGIACSCMGWNADLTAKTLMRTVDQHRAHVAEQIQPLIDAEKRAAWDEGHRTRQRLGDDDCRCGAWAEIECACGKYGTNVITPNPLRHRSRVVMAHELSPPQDRAVRLALEVGRLRATVARVEALFDGRNVGTSGRHLIAEAEIRAALATEEA